MKKRLFAYIFVLLMLLSAAVPAAFAEETAETTAETVERVETDETLESEQTEETEEIKNYATSGDCGKDLTWNLEDGVLTVTGSSASDVNPKEDGIMDAGCPWEAHKDKIEKVVFRGCVTVVGAEAFMDCDKLRSVEFGSYLREIDTRAFYDCDSLTQIHVPATFRRFGVESFAGCDSLVTVYCDGGMPSFNGNCLWNGNHITIYTPINNPWPQEHVEVLVNNFGGRLEIICGGESVYDYTEPTEETEPTTVPTEPETEPVTEPETQPQTEPVTEPETQPQTEPATEPETQPETTLAAETEPEQTDGEQTIVEKAGSSGWIWMVIVAAGVTCLLILALVIRMVAHKDGKYSD